MFCILENLCPLCFPLDLRFFYSSGISNGMVMILLVFLIIGSNNTHKLASGGNLLFFACCKDAEVVWAWTIWSTNCGGFWNFKRNLNWIIEPLFGFQLCRILSGKFLLNIWNLDALFHGCIKILSLLYWSLLLNKQMTKLAIIPCTVLLETLFLLKTFRLVTFQSP